MTFVLAGGLFCEVIAGMRHRQAFRRFSMKAQTRQLCSPLRSQFLAMTMDGRW